MFFQKYKKIILAIIILIVLFVIYSNFFSSKTTEDQLLTSSLQRNPAQIVGNEIITALNQIESLQLSREIFEDPVYRSLIDRSEPIPEEPIGKMNPFAPIGATSIRTTTTNSNSATSSTSRTNTIINTTNNKPVSVPVI